MRETFIISTILLSGCVLLHASRHLLGLWLKLFLLVALVVSFNLYTNFGRMDMIFPKDTAYREKYGSTPRHTYLHWHEIYHYYLGGKYFPELQYKGLYETLAYADSISHNPVVTAMGMRSLRAPTYPITMEEALRRGREEFRPRFTEARWASLMADLAAMKAIGDKGWLDIGLFDAGYNPPPSWAVIGHTVASLIPITQEEAWGGDQRPEWYQVQWVTLFDPLMLAIALGFVTWAFGALGAVAFLLFFFLSEPAHFGWIAGSFFRYTWLAALMTGLSFLRKQRYLAAGMFLGLASMDRIFPLAFLGAAGVSILAACHRARLYRPFLRYAGGAAAVISIMLGLSVLMFGMEAWAGFLEKILAHKDLYFVHHIGYRRIAVFSPDILNQNFWWEPGLDRFREWNAKLVARWLEVRPLHLILWAVMITAAVFASLRARAEEAALMLGGLLFFLFEIGANYYYIYFPMVFVVLLASPPTRLRQVILAAYVALWASLWYFAASRSDDLLNNYHKCSAIFAFFCLWVFGRAGETLAEMLRGQYGKQAAKSP